MLSTAELAHKRDPKAIAEIIRQELQILDTDRLAIEVAVVDSSLEIQIRTDSAIDKEKLMALVRSELKDLHIESVAKFRIHCWRNDEEMHEQRLLWTEQFMLDVPQLSPRVLPDLKPEPDRVKLPETRSPEPQLSKHSVLQQAIANIAPTNHQAQKHTLASNLDQQPSDESKTNSSLVVTRSYGQKSKNSRLSDNIYWQLLLVGVSIVLLGLGIGASVKALTSKSTIDSSSSIDSIENKSVKSATATIKNTPSQTIDPSVVTNSPTTSKVNPSNSVEPILPNPNLQDQEQVVTLEKFNRIQKGMTIDQVEKIFGASGKVIAENNSGNSIGQVYSWKNPYGSNAIIEFKDGQVVAKAQAGL